MGDKIAIVTGSTGNLGQAVIKKFLSEGLLVVGTVTQHDKISGGKSLYENHIVDLTNEEDSAKFISTVIRKHKKIDVAVLTVGGFAMGDMGKTTLVDIQKQYKLNFETAFNVARPIFLQMMKQGDGRIFMIGSKPGLEAKNAKGMVAYSLAKALLFRLAELMNIEAKGKNVVTAVIVPSTIDTPENRRSMPDADTGNWVKAETIAEVISFYCSEKAVAIREPVIKVYNNG